MSQIPTQKAPSGYHGLPHQRLYTKWLKTSSVKHQLSTPPPILRQTRSKLPASFSRDESNQPTGLSNSPSPLLLQSGRVCSHVVRRGAGARRRYTSSIAVLLLLLLLLLVHALLHAVHEVRENLVSWNCVARGGGRRKNAKRRGIVAHHNVR